MPNHEKLPTTLFKFLFHFIKKQRFTFSLLFFTSIAWAINESLFPYFIKILINTANEHKNEVHEFAYFKKPLIALSIIWLIQEFSIRFQGFFAIGKAFPVFRGNIREAVFKYTNHHSHDYFISHFAGDIANKISDLPTSSEAIIEILFFHFLGTLIMFSISFVLLWKVNIFFGIVLFAWLIVHISLILIFLNKIQITSQTHANSNSALVGKIVDSITNIFNVRLFSRELYEIALFKKYQSKEIIAAKNSIWTLEALKTLQSIAASTFIISMLILLIHGWSHNWVSLGDFSLIAMSSFNLLSMIWYLSYSITNFVKQSGKINAALVLINVPHSIKDIHNAHKLKVTKGMIVFENVTFSYSNRVNIFEDNVVIIPAHQKIGLVGLSGSGKTTFVNLILRFYELSSGKILIDNQDIAQVTQESLRKQISMIPQDPTLFHRTLYENIAYGNLDATPEKVFEASKKAHCHEFISQLDEGYNALVGERGIKLSTGQRQRISIARAILKNAPILILDEATSALDSLTESFIQKSLETLMKDKTCIVIAHRLSTLNNMDRILVFQEGVIVEDGSALELLSHAQGHFKKLWDMQTHGFLPDA